MIAGDDKEGSADRESRAELRQVTIKWIQGEEECKLDAGKESEEMIVKKGISPKFK